MDKPKKEYVMIGISPDIHAKLKIQCAIERRTIKTVVEEIILAYLERTEADSKKTIKTKP